MQLANFNALIELQRIADDGMREEVRFVISGETPSGPLPPIELTASEFLSMSWVSRCWGNQAIVMAGASIKDAMRAAIQLLSGVVPIERVFEHVGMRRIHEEWCYLHRGGALRATGNDDGVTVDMSRYDGGGRMSYFELPAPPVDGALRDALHAALGLAELSPRRELGYLLLAIVGRAPLGGALPADFAVYFAGRTGAKKSEAAALVQQFYGSQFNARAFPANWDDTITNLTAKLAAAKDAVSVVDDFRPRGSVVEVAQLHSKADTIFRSAGNQAGRGRSQPNLRALPNYYPRGFVIATGEDIPRGHSLRARLLVYEMQPGEIRCPELTRLQAAGRSGQFAGVMAAYIQRLLVQMETLPDELRAEIQRTREVLQPFSHPRGVDIYANLWAGLRRFLDFAHGAGALDDEAYAAHKRDGNEALLALMQAQGELQEEEDEVIVFLRALRSAFQAGACHLCNAETGREPNSMPHAWGWRSLGVAPPEWVANGVPVGHIDHEFVYLEPGAAFAVANKTAREQGKSITVGERTLYVRMKEQNLLARTKPGPQAYTLRKSIRGVQDPYVWLTVKSLRGLSE